MSRPRVTTACFAAISFCWLIGSPLPGVLSTTTIVSAADNQQDHTAAATITPTLSRIDLDDFRGRRWKLDDFDSDQFLVVAFLGTECPLAKLYAARLQTMQDQLATKGVRVIGVMSNRHDSLLDITAFANRQEIKFPLLKDAGARLADELDARRTPEIYVFDRDRKLRYRGRVDDQYGIGYVRDQPRRKDLQAALEELIAGQTVSIERTDAVGCIIGRKKTVSDSSEVTYGGQIAKLLHRHCVECHREGEIAPFALTDYEEVAGWADMIAEVVRDQRMPPWHADPKHGSFENERRLTDDEKQLLYDWAEAGAPAGDLTDLPTLPEKVTGWQLPREPDLVFHVSPEPFTVQAEGAVKYQYFRIAPNLEKDVWIHAAELKPGNRSVVHHILAFAVPRGSRELNGARGFLVGYVPGMRVAPWPDGHAKRIPAGSELVFQVHYTPIGVEVQDHSQLGICLLDESEVTREIVTTSAVETNLRIPPHEPDYRADAAGPRFPDDAKLLAMSPHMHVRGKSFRYALESNQEVLLSVPEYDFNWQTTYVLDPPLELKANDRIICNAVFDNSKKNLNNPAPEATVRWGDQTEDEMMIGYYHLSVPRGDTPAGKTGAERRRQMVERAIRLATFDRIDQDGDGSITKAETPRRLHKIFAELDTNRDDILTRREVEAK
ncbi:redoxin domain-containing protein [Roseiconus lacunae]|uniref:redoxin domain-containing protein n=1 Tax=Roseiconus lacunae TaxID=2605694 RepID=UPI0011F1F990|nr:redoxin domain-containing protein [Roseiconus lacunae]MCD0463271.1 redoxin domain-containing protein [Roseiconus lacunae]WRQ52528.1 redoxin domain-containing protein [Stieleria sp. HD01]